MQKNNHRRKVSKGTVVVCRTLPKLEGNSRIKYRKVHWIMLGTERVGPGDFWAASGTNPNEPERQGDGNFNLQLQAISPIHYGIRANDIGRVNGEYWRPVGIVEVY